MGPFLKSFGTKWKKKPKARCETPQKGQLFDNTWVHGGGGGVGGVKVQVYAAPMHEEGDVEAPHSFVHLQCEVEFDPEKDYAQVLAEARTHLKLAKPSDHNPTPWLHPIASPQNHVDAYRELHSQLSKPTKASKFWRYFLFWQKPSTNHLIEAEFESIFSTPPHPAFKQSCNDMCHGKRRAIGKNVSMAKWFGPTRKGSSGPLNFGPRHTSKGNSGPLNIGPRHTSKGNSGPLATRHKPTRKNNSGPLYTDGLPSSPYNVRQTKKSYSGPLGAMSSNHSNDHLSSYELLRRPPLSSPLYSC